MIIGTDRAEHKGREPRAGQRDRKNEGESDIRKDREGQIKVKDMREQRSDRIGMRGKMK